MKESDENHEQKAMPYDASLLIIPKFKPLISAYWSLKLWSIHYSYADIKFKSSFSISKKIVGLLDNSGEISQIQQLPLEYCQNGHRKNWILIHSTLKFRIMHSENKQHCTERKAPIRPKFMFILCSEFMTKLHYKEKYLQLKSRWGSKSRVI